jgi:transposase InsO family protein
MTFDNHLRRRGIKQIRTPYRSPRANAVAERWVKSTRSECLDHLFIFSEAVLRRDLSSTFLTSIIGGRIDRSDNGHRAIRKNLGLRLSGKSEKSSQTLYSVACTTSVSSQHDTSGRVSRALRLHARGEGPAPPLAHPERPRVVASWECRHLPFV